MGTVLPQQPAEEHIVGRYEEDRLRAIGSGPSYASPSDAALALRSRLDVVRMDLRHGRITAIEALRLFAALCDDVLSCDLGVSPRDEHGYYLGQLLVLDERARALAAVSDATDDPTIVEYVTLVSRLMPMQRELGAIDHRTGEPRALVEIGIRIGLLERHLGIGLSS
jgi:hypothetical protein